VSRSPERPRGDPAAGGYVHGYTAREAERLHDQAATLRELLHHDTAWPAGSLVLEGGTGVGATTAIVAARNPAVRLVSLDGAADSLRQAQAALRAAGLGRVALARGDLYRLPCADGAFDHGFLCFVLEHLAHPLEALAELRRAVKRGGTITVVEGDHGSCYFHPETPAARAAWQCLIRVQAELGGDSLIGRRLQPLLLAAGLREVAVSPRMVYCDAARPQWLDGFVKRTIIPMVEGVREQALARGYIDAATWAQGIADLHATGTAPEGTFCYAFFKGVGVC
jgi:SAM-dependent methyltransferase